MSKEHSFVPISEIESPKVKFSLQFPGYVDTEEIGVNLNSIHSLCKMGGIKHLRVLGSYGGEVSSVQPTVLGMDEQGQAVAGYTGLKSVSKTHTEDFNVDDEYVNKPHAYRWVDASINLNMNEISATIGNENWSRGLRSPDGWAHHINTALKEGISHTGISHLLFGLSSDNWIRTVGLNSLVLGLNTVRRPLSGDIDLHFPRLEEVSLGYAAVNIFGNGISYMDRLKTDDPYRFSLFFGPQIDRALLLKLMTKTSTLAKSIEPSSS